MPSSRLHPVAVALAVVLAGAAAAGAGAAEFRYDGHLDPRRAVFLAAAGGTTQSPAWTIPGMVLRDGRFRFDIDGLPEARGEARVRFAVRAAGDAGTFLRIDAQSASSASGGPDPLPLQADRGAAGDGSSRVHPADDFAMHATPVAGNADNGRFRLRAEVRVTPEAKSADGRFALKSTNASCNPLDFTLFMDGFEI